MLKGLTIHEYLTRDHAKVRAAVEAIGVKAMAGRAEDIEDEYWQQAQEATTDDRYRINIEANREAHRNESKIQAEHYLERLTILAKALRYVPGQKQIVLFSSGVPSSLVFGHQVGRAGEVDKWGNVLQKSKFDPGDSRLRERNEEMYKEFSASNCTLYTFDTREAASVQTLFNYDERTFLVGARDLFEEDGVYSNSTNVFKDEKVTGRDSLKRFSDITGGKYYSNINKYEKNLGEVQSLTSSYYVLGYRASEQPDGKFHEVKVEVKRKGFLVRAQTGYFNPKPFREYSELEKQLHLFDLALNQRSVLGAPKTFPMTGLTYDAGEGIRLRVLARVTKEVLEEFSGKSVEFVALFFDDQENLSSLQRTAIDLSGYRGAGILFSAGAAPKPGPVHCRIVVRDLDTGQSAVASAKAYVVIPDPAKLALYSPLLLILEGQIMNLDGTARGRLDHQTWHDIYPYDATQYSPVTGDDPVRAGKIVVVVPFTIPGRDEHDVAFSVYLVNSAAGQNLPISIQPLNRLVQGNVHVQFLEIALDQVPSGKYMVYINAGDRSTGALASAHVPLTITR